MHTILEISVNEDLSVKLFQISPRIKGTQIICDRSIPQNLFYQKHSVIIKYSIM